MDRFCDLHFWSTETTGGTESNRNNRSTFILLYYHRIYRLSACSRVIFAWKALKITRGRVRSSIFQLFTQLVPYRFRYILFLWSFRFFYEKNIYSVARCFLSFSSPMQRDPSCLTTIYVWSVCIPLSYSSCFPPTNKRQYGTNRLGSPFLLVPRCSAQNRPRRRSAPTSINHFVVVILCRDRHCPLPHWAGLRLVEESSYRIENAHRSVWLCGRTATRWYGVWFVAFNAARNGIHLRKHRLRSRA